MAIDTSRVDGLVPSALLQAKIKVIGLGAVGSKVVEQLVLLGFKNIEGYDYDTVDSLNVTNQIYSNSHIGKSKAESLEAIIQTRYFRREQSPFKAHNQKHDGVFQDKQFIILNCVDDVDARKEISRNVFMQGTVTYYGETFLGVWDFSSHFGIVNGEYRNHIENLYVGLDDLPDSDELSPCGGKISCGFAVDQLVGGFIESIVRSMRDLEITRIVKLKDRGAMIKKGE